MVDSITELENQVTKLTGEWMNTIGSIHHKDRDCHHCIKQVWSYGESPKWVVDHSGYLEDPNEFYHEASTHRECLEFLIIKLMVAIERWKDVDD